MYLYIFFFHFTPALAPKDSLELAKAEMIIDRVVELENGIISALLEQDSAKKVVNEYVQ